MATAIRARFLRSVMTVPLRRAVVRKTARLIGNTLYYYQSMVGDLRQPAEPDAGVMRVPASSQPRRRHHATPAPWGTGRRRGDASPRERLTRGGVRRARDRIPRRAQASTETRAPLHEALSAP